jgi:hypothetical protein
MPYRQLIIPNPNISCRPGWCLEYVRRTYNQKATYTTAISNWNSSPSKHRDKNFPNCDIPIWFSLENDPRGHVALRMRDGSVYSASSSTSTIPVHHSSIDTLIKYYAKSNPLTYVGWTEDIENVKVIEEVQDMVTRDLISLLYRGILGREIDEAGFANVGLPVDVVVTRLIQSPEFAQREAKLNTKPTVTKVDVINYISSHLS